MNILLIGPYPPPLGGNSVHIQRLLSLLQAAHHRVKVLDIFSTNHAASKPAEVLVLTGGVLRKLAKLRAAASNTPPDTIVHIHVSAMRRFKWFAPLLLVLFWRQPKVITIHSGSFIEQTSTTWIRLYVKQILRWFSQIIVVNEEQIQHLKTLGIPLEKIDVIPAFLPPTPDISGIPPEITTARGNKMLAVTSGYLTPIYHYDLLIDCIAQLDPQKYHFIFSFYNTIDPEYKAHIYGRLEQLNNVSISHDLPPNVFAGILSQSDVYVRTTLTDGDAVAVREALYFNKTVFASDCVKRPAACHLFKTGDSQDLLRLFSDKAENHAQQEAAETQFQRILTVYEKAQRLAHKVEKK